MKKTFLTILSVAAIAIAALTINSCTKQESAEQAFNVAGKHPPQMTAEDISVYNRIMNFKKKVDYIKSNPEYKSGEEMSVDSAKWYLDASFNLTYGFINDTFSTFKTDTFSLVISKTGNMIGLNEVSAAFYEMKDKTLVIYNATEGYEKQLYLSHMEITDNAADQVVMKTTATIGAKTNEQPPGLSQWGPFVEGDDWMYGEKLGDCSTGGGIWWGIKDAATELEYYRNYYRKKHDSIGPGLVAFYTEPSATTFLDVKDGMGTYSELLLNPNDDVIDNDRDYLLLYQKKDLPNLIIHTCIPWDEMNFYYHGLDKILYHIIQENYNYFGVHESLSFMFCTIDGIGDININDPDIAHHHLTATYKTRHIMGEGTQPTSIAN